jgi:hypothetical protein
MRFNKITIAATIFVAVMLSYNAFTFMRAGFGDSTGAPLKKEAVVSWTSCAATGCHVGRAVNSGNGWVDIISDIPTSGWEPGKSYKITAKIYHPNRYVFGFKLLAWGSKDSLSVGTLSADPSVDSATIAPAVVKNPLGTVLGTNQYATHRLRSVGGPHSGENRNEWSFTWTAPAVRDQEVVFYAAFVAGNGNGAASGDFVYTYSKNADVSSIANTTSLFDFDSQTKYFSIYPTQVTDVLMLRGSDIHMSKLKYMVLRNDGTIVKSGDIESAVLYLPDIAQGAYNLVLYNNQVKESHKFIKL